jgi:hypothetical protein
MQRLLMLGIFSQELGQSVSPFACPCPYQGADRILVGPKECKVQSPDPYKVGDQASLDPGTVPAPALGPVQGRLCVAEADLPSH